MSRPRKRKFDEQIEAFFGGVRCFLLSKGRVGLYVGLKALDLPPGSKVLMPGYTCMVVPSAVQYAGLKPVYIDIDPDTYNLNMALLEHVSAADVSAVIIQHTYGIPCDADPIRTWAQSEAVFVIEDCCHTFGGRVNGRLCGTLGSLAFMSGQWNKPFPTGLGGMLLVNDPKLAEKVEQILERQAHRPGTLRNLMLRAQILLFEAFVKPRTAARITRFYRFLNRYGLVIGSSSNQELQGRMPDGYLSLMAPCQRRKGSRELARIEENIRHRKTLTRYYSEKLPEIGFAPLRSPDEQPLPLLRYPVRVANKHELLRESLKRRVEIGSWFEAPLHPAGTRMEDFGYRPGMCPEAEAACAQVINLPTHLKVDEATAEKTIAFLREYGRPV